MKTATDPKYKPYANNPPSLFGVENTGLPYGCGYEWVVSPLCSG